jgi:monofunctional biosynthetic peptidoglycan transglycosylase
MLVLGVLGITLGVILYEAIMFVRVFRLRSNNPSSTSLMDIRASEAKEKGRPVKREQLWVPLDKISTNLQRADLAGEDTNFSTHRGFDYEAIRNAWDQAQRESAREAKKEGEDDDWLPSLPEFKRGGSTISQQLAKNLYLSSQRSLFRKGQEAALSVMLERSLNKRRLLEIYLIVIEWGEPATTVEFIFKPVTADSTYVIIKNFGFYQPVQELLALFKDLTGGFTTVLDGLKAYLEHNINLNLIADKFAAGDTPYKD